MNTKINWTVGTQSNGPKNHAICDGPTILATVNGNGYPIGTGWAPSSEETARFIVKAANSHHDLLAALIELVAEFDANSGEAAEEQGVIGLAETGGIMVARTAIAKATP